MASKKIFIDGNSKVDLSALGARKDAEIIISGPDMKIVSPQGTMILVNGALYSSLKDSQLSVKFSDGSFLGSKLMSTVNLENIQLQDLNSVLVESEQQNKKNRQEEEEQSSEEKQNKADQQKKEEEAIKKAEKAQQEAEEAAAAAIKEAAEAQKASEEISERLKEFLNDNQSKSTMSQLAEGLDAAKKVTPVVKPEPQAPLVDIKPVKPINSSSSNSRGKSNNPPVEEKKEVEINFGLHKDSNSGDKNDNLTNVTSPKFVGNTEAGASVVIKMGDELIARSIADSDGKFDFISPGKLVDGEYTFTAVATDANGNKGSAQQTIIIDTIPPDPPSVNLTELVKASDGRIFTNKKMPTVEGTAEPGAIVIIKIKGHPDASAKVNSNGKWQYTFSRQLDDGAHQMSFIAEDGAGNQSSPPVLYDFIIKTNMPQPTATLNEDDDSGVKGDWITNQQDTLRLTGTAEKEANVAILIGDKLIGSPKLDKNGNWSFVIPGPLAEDKYNINIVATDILGLEKTQDYLLTIDTSTPDPEVIMDPGSDSGEKGDSITNVKRPLFTGTAEKNATVTIFINGKEKKSVPVNSNGTWSYRPDTDLLDDHYKMLVKVKDIAANEAESKEYEFEIRSKTSKPTIELVDKTGIEDTTANLTNLQVFTLKGTADPGAKVTLYLDERPLVTVPVGHDGTWSHALKKGEITKSGQYNFQAKVVDIADNKEESFILEVEVDLSVEIDAITLVDNTGQDKTENFTNVKNPKFAITVPSDVIKMEVSLDNGNTWQTVNKPVVNKPNGKDQIVWNYQIPTDPVLAQETYTLLVKVLDKAGNKNTKNQNFTIDTDINAPAITLDPASYSKGENQDNLTNITQPKFNLTGIDSDITTLIVTVKNQDKNTLETITITRTMTGLPQDPQPGDWKIEVRDANGTLVKGAQPELKQQKIGSDWQLSLKQPLKDGKHTLSIQTKDRAGNDSEKLSDDKKSPALELKIDTVLSIPTLTLDTESDTGIQQDNITKNIQPAFNLGGIDDDITDINIKVTDSSGKIIETVIATRTVIPKTSGWTIKVVGTDGNEVASHQAGLKQKGKGWQLTLNQALDDGHYQLSIETEDRAGNKSSELHENDPSSLLSLEIDSNISVPEIRLDSESDTGDSKSDNITNITEPTFNLTGIDPDVIKITLKINGDETVTATRESIGNPAKPGVWSIHPAGSAVLKENNDHWQITLKNPLKQGMHQLSIETEDRAGNKSSETHRNPPESLTLHIDTELSTPLIVLDEGSYSGIRLGNLTNKTSPAFKLSDIDNDITTLTITVKNKTGSVVEKIIATRAVGIDKEPNPEGWTIVVDGVKNNQVKLTPQGTDWLLTLNQELVHGKYELNIETEDRAGNKSSDLPQTKKPQPLTLTIDTEAPDAPVISLASDSGVAGDNITKETQPTFKLELKDLAQDVIKLIITVTDQKDEKNTAIGSFTATKNSQGEWSLEPKGGSLTEDGRLKLSSAVWQDGDYRLSVIAEDQAGNQSKKPEKLNFDIDTALTPPRITLDAESDSGDSNSDKLTNKTAPIFNLTGIDLDTTTLIITVKKEGSIVETVTAKRKVTGEQNKPKPGEWDITVTGKDGNQLGTPLASLTGKDRDWQLTLSQQLTHGEYQLTVESEDRAGNKSSDEHREKPDPLTIQIDTELSTPTISLDSGSDSGEKDNDNITNKTEPVFNLSHIDNDITTLTITVRKGDNIVETIIARREVGTAKEPQSEKWTFEVKNAEGHKIDNGKVGLTETSKDWKLTLSQALKHGEYQLSIDTQDRAGNKSSDEHRKQPEPLTLHIDTELSTPLIVLDEESYSGIRLGNLTNKTSPAFKLIDIDKDITSLTITVKNETNKIVETIIATRAVGTDKEPNPEGWTIVVDGVKNNQVKLTPQGTDWLLTLNKELVHGKYELNIETEDRAGNKSSDLPQTKKPQPLTLTIDTEAPDAPVISLESDTGVAGDNITKETRPTFKLELKDLAQDVIKLIIAVTDKEGNSVTYDDGKNTAIGSFTATKDNQGKWRLEPGDGSLTEDGRLKLSSASWKDGDYLISVIAEDQAGNQSTAPEKLNFDIDTVLTLPRITLDAESDSGDSTSDNLTNKTAPIFNLTDIDFDTTTLIITVKKGDNIVETITAKRKVTGSHKEPKPDAWDIRVTGEDGKPLDTLLASLTEKGTDWQLTLSQQLTHGEYQLTIESEDRAGNKSSDLNIEAPSSLNLTIDTVKPPAPPMCLVEDHERGESNDHLTNVSTPIFMLDLSNLAEDVTKITIKVTDRADKEVQYPNSDENIGTFTATRDAAGEWTLTPSGGSLFEDGKLSLSSNKWKDGDYKLVVNAHDKAGNTSEKPTLFEFNLDTQITLPGILLDTASDTGDNTSDNITRITTPTFNLTGIDDDLVNISIKVTDDQEKIISTLTATRKVTKNGAKEWTVQPPGAVLENKEGNWQIILKDELPDGEYNVNIVTEDRAGNKSSDEHREKPDPLVIHIDTELSTPTISLDSGSDSGEKDNDNITNITKPTFNLTGIDPDVTKITLKIASDNNKDEIVTVTRELTGNSAKLGEWSIHPAGSAVLAVLKENAGHWQITLKNPLKQGMHQLSIETEDRAGNKSSDDHRNPPEPLTLHIDTELSTPLIVLDEGSYSGIRLGNLTNKTSPAFKLIDIDKDITSLTITVKNETNNIVETIIATRAVGIEKDPVPGEWTIVVDGVKNNQVKLTPQGTDWLLTLNKELVHGKYELNIETEDRAGNKSSDLPQTKKPQPLTLTIDTEAPDAPLISLERDTGVVGDNITN